MINEMTNIEMQILLIVLALDFLTFIFMGLICWREDKILRKQIEMCGHGLGPGLGGGYGTWV